MLYVARPAPPTCGELATPADASAAAPPAPTPAFRASPVAVRDLVMAELGLAGDLFWLPCIVTKIILEDRKFDAKPLINCDLYPVDPIECSFESSRVWQPLAKMDECARLNFMFKRLKERTTRLHKNAAGRPCKVTEVKTSVLETSKGQLMMQCHADKHGATRVQLVRLNETQSSKLGVCDVEDLIKLIADPAQTRSEAEALLTRKKRRLSQLQGDSANAADTGGTEMGSPAEGPSTALVVVPAGQNQAGDDVSRKFECESESEFKSDFEMPDAPDGDPAVKQSSIREQDLLVGKLGNELASMQQRVRECDEKYKQAKELQNKMHTLKKCREDLQEVQLQWQEADDEWRQADDAVNQALLNRNNDAPGFEKAAGRFNAAKSKLDAAKSELDRLTKKERKARRACFQKAGPQLVD
jgi:hypothetical protein